MSKDYLRDYSTEAFRFYGRIGSAEAYKRNLYLKALEEQCRVVTGSSTISNPTEAMIVRAQAAVDEKISEILDLEAVEKTLNEFKVRQRNEIVQAVEEVYFDNNEALKRCNIKDRVLAASNKLNFDERSIYRFLKKARILFAINRGLRL